MPKPISRKQLVKVLENAYLGYYGSPYGNKTSWGMLASIATRLQEEFHICGKWQVDSIHIKGETLWQIICKKCGWIRRYPDEIEDKDESGNKKESGGKEEVKTEKTTKENEYEITLAFQIVKWFCATEKRRNAIIALETVLKNYKEGKLTTYGDVANAFIDYCALTDIDFLEFDKAIHFTD